MADFHDLMQKHGDLSEEAQKRAGQAIPGDMSNEHRGFLTSLMKLLDSGEISADNPQSILKKDVYDALSAEWQDKVDLALVNIANQIRLIEDFARSEQTPDSSPQLQTMIEHLWVMKQRIEDTHDVFKI